MAKAKLVVVLDSSSADRLGVLLSQIADLTEQADAIKDAIKDSGLSIEGALFKATYCESNRSSFDKEAFVKAYSQTVYEQFTRTSAVFSVKVTAR